MKSFSRRSLSSWHWRILGMTSLCLSHPHHSYSKCTENGVCCITGRMSNFPSMEIPSLQEQSCWWSSRSWLKQILYSVINCNSPILKIQGYGPSSIKGNSYRNAMWFKLNGLAMHLILSDFKVFILGTDLVSMPSIYYLWWVHLKSFNNHFYYCFLLKVGTLLWNAVEKKTKCLWGWK